MVKRVIDDDKYVIIPKKCIDKYTYTESNSPVWGFILVLIILIVIYVFIMLSSTHGFYTDASGVYHQY
jgi:uncharacterized integral membrane protein